MQDTSDSCHSDRLSHSIWDTNFHACQRTICELRVSGMHEKSWYAQGIWSSCKIRIFHGNKEVGARACRETQSHLHVRDIIKTPPCWILVACTQSQWKLRNVVLGDLEVWWSPLGQSLPSGILEFIGSRQFLLLTSSSESFKPSAKTKVSQNEYFYINMQVMHIIQNMQYSTIIGQVCIFILLHIHTISAKYAKYVDGTRLNSIKCILWFFKVQQNGRKYKKCKRCQKFKIWYLYLWNGLYYWA